MAAFLCSMPGCQTTAGCICSRVSHPKSLSDYSDAEIAREYHSRCLRVLGDQSVGVSVPSPGPTGFPLITIVP